MPGKKGGGENTKKAAGNARKAEAAAAKKAAKDQESERQEAAQWKQGSKDTSKADAASAKKAEADRKRAEKAALLAEEEASLPSKASKTKVTPKKTRGLDLSGLDDPDLLARASKTAPTINASGIDNALDALALDSKSASTEQIDRHPERRYKAAYAVFEERRLEEMKDDKGLRRQQKVELIRKEFEKHPDNPFNQVSARYNASRDEIKDMKDSIKEETENRLADAA